MAGASGADLGGLPLRKTLLVLVAAIAGTVGAHAAHASSQFMATFQMAYLSSHPAVSTGLTTVMTWSDPGAPGAAPKAISKIELRFNPGTRFDTSALPTCGASDAEVRAMGASACPADSQLGSGSTIGVFATGMEFTTQVTLFNANGEIIVLVTVNGVPVTEFRDEVQTDKIIVNPALPPGVSLKRLALQIDPHSTGSRAAQKAYMRTPPTCPSSRRWTIVGVFTYADTSSQTLTSGSPCQITATHPGQGGSHPAKRVIRLTVGPREADVGRRIRFRFHATTLVAGRARSVRAATIHFAGHTARTDRYGRTTIIKRLERPSRYHAFARKPGYVTGRTLVIAHT